MYVTSIRTNDVYVFNGRMSSIDFEDFKKFAIEFNSNNEVYCFVQQMVFNKFAVYYSNDLQIGKNLVNLYYTSKNPENQQNYNEASFKINPLNKYIANFHTKDAALCFAEYLKELTDPKFFGFDKKVRNSVVFYCNDDEFGHEISKKFEENYVQTSANNNLNESAGNVHPIDDDQKVYDLTETTVASEDGSTFTKIFSIFKGNHN